MVQRVVLDSTGLRIDHRFHGNAFGRIWGGLGHPMAVNLGANHMGFPTINNGQTIEEIIKLLKKDDSQSVVLSYNKIQLVWTR